MVFVLKPKPHPRFSRRGADLVHKVVMPLHQALIGTSVQVKMLDERTLSVPISDIMTPGSVVTVPNEGMAKPGGGKGNLILEIELLFPTHLSQAQKMLLKSAFYLPPVQNEEQKAAVRAFEAAFTHELKGWATVYPKQLQQ